MPKNRYLAKNPAKRSSLKPVTLLLAGFDAFAGDKYNPSQLVVEAFPDILVSKPRGQSRVVKEIHIRKEILPTAGVKGWKQLKKALDEAVAGAEGQVIVLMLGLAAIRQNISLERFAMNFRDYRIADNSGERRLDETIEAKGAQLLRTNLDLPYLRYLTNTVGFPCEISNHAGTFVCNELYFRALNYANTHTKVSSVLFMHLPREKEFAKTAKNAKNDGTPKELAQRLKGISKAGKSKQIALLGDAVLEVAENIAHDLVNTSAARRK
jgi:pyroglutamyl-peptidase